MAKAG
jgi:hypothetical protein